MNPPVRTAADWQELAGRARGLMERGQQDEAEQLLAAAIGNEDAPGGIWLLAGLVALRRGETAAAVTRLEQAAVRNPQSADNHYNLGVALLEAGRRDDAQQRFREALHRRPEHVPAATNLAEMLTRDGDWTEAIQLCRETLSRAGGAGRLWLALAEALRRAGELDRADEALAEAVRHLPGNPDVHNRLGILRKTQGRLHEAVACYRQALEAAPGRPGIHNNLGLALLADDAHRDALAAFDEALRLRPGWTEALVNRAAALARLGRPADAEATARRAVEAAPDNPAALAAMAALLSGGREPERLQEAERLARRALARDHTLAGAHDTLGIVLMKSGHREAAIEAGRAAVSMAPETPAHAEHLADHLARLERLEEASTVLETALGHCPGNTVLQRQLGIVRLCQGKTPEALELFDHRLRQDPQDQRAIAHKAVALERLGRVPAARRLLGLDRFVRRVRLHDVAPFPDLASFNQALVQDIHDHPTLQWEPVGLAARGGALTGELLDAPTEAIRVFERNLRRAIDDWIAELDAEPAHPFLGGIPRAYRLNTWATLVPEQGEISAHIHEESWLSGAYYPRLPDAMGDDGPAGWIEFGRPSAELPAVPDDALRLLRPEEGLLLLFPSYLFHRTLPFHGEGERVSLSFDVEPVEKREES